MKRTRNSRGIKPGDYVHAAHWSDYDPNDPWRIGFVIRIIDTWRPHPTLPTRIDRSFVIGEENGDYADGREYRHAKRITREEGEAFLKKHEDLTR